MERVSKKTRKISVSDLLGLDASDSADENYLQFKDLLLGLQQVMIEKKVSMSELAKRMKISRQAIYDKFAGKNTSMQWIMRACRALKVEIKVAFVDQAKVA